MTDRRSHFATEDLAHTSLKGMVDVPRFSAGELCRVVAPVAPIYANSTDRPLQRQSLFGSQVTRLAVTDGRAFVRDEIMGYVGYMPNDALAPWSEPTHVVAARSTLAFEKPDFKSPDPMVLSLGSRICIRQQEGIYAQSSDGRFLIASHLRPIDTPECDPVDVAARLIGTPYLWGGNSSAGIDCSGLVQIALAACGRSCPGDSDQQCKILGQTMPEGTSPARGDLLFWKGHVAWVVDANTIVHANACAMAVVFEDLEAAVHRIKAQGDGPVTRHARLL